MGEWMTWLKGFGLVWEKGESEMEESYETIRKFHEPFRVRINGSIIYLTFLFEQRAERIVMRNVKGNCQLKWRFCRESVAFSAECGMEFILRMKGSNTVTEGKLKCFWSIILNKIGTFLFILIYSRDSKSIFLIRLFAFFS